MSTQNFISIKRFTLLTFLICISFQINGQKNPREKVKAYKIAYITEQLDLTSEEAQLFWPVYNEHEASVEQLKREGRKLIRGLKEASHNSNEMTDEQAGEFLKNYLKTEEQKTEVRKKLVLNLQKILPDKKILKLIKAEADFNKRLLERFRQKRMHRKN